MRRFIVMLAALLLLSMGTAVLAQSSATITHVVQPGENLFRISIRYGVSIAAIQAANPIIRNPNLIYAGSVLIIPTGGTVPSPPTQPPGQPPLPQTPSSKLPGTVPHRQRIAARR